MGNTVICVLNVDLGANYCSDFCLSSAIHCMGKNIKLLAAFVCVSACLHVRSYKWALVGKCVRISWPCGEGLTCRRLVGIPTRNNAKSKRFRLF